MATHELAKPFLRWAGGKQWLTQRLLALMPAHSGSYFEPFVGSASLFFAARPTQAVLGDLNRRLIETYTTVRDRPKEVLAYLAQWPNNKTTYYRIRSAMLPGRIQRAAQFIYLNKTCWNGLYRVNKEGGFNVPYGFNRERDVVEHESFLSAAKALSSASLVCGDFEDVVSQAKSGDFVYFDPPYTVMHSTNGFRRYNERIFSWEDQIRLARVASALSASGCHVIVSNANHQSVIDLYGDFAYYALQRHSRLAGDPNHRRKIEEGLFISESLVRPEMPILVKAL